MRKRRRLLYVAVFLGLAILAAFTLFWYRGDKICERLGILGDFGEGPAEVLPISLEIFDQLKTFQESGRLIINAVQLDGLNPLTGKNKGVRALAPGGEDSCWGFFEIRPAILATPNMRMRGIFLDFYRADPVPGGYIPEYGLPPVAIIWLPNGSLDLRWSTYHMWKAIRQHGHVIYGSFEGIAKAMN